MSSREWRGKTNEKKWRGRWKKSRMNERFEGIWLNGHGSLLRPSANSLRCYTIRRICNLYDALLFCDTRTLYIVLGSGVSNTLFPVKRQYHSEFHESKDDSIQRYSVCNNPLRKWLAGLSAQNLKRIWKAYFFVDRLTFVIIIVQAILEMVVAGSCSSIFLCYLPLNSREK